MRQDVTLNAFNAGELSPLLKGRTDVEKYFNGCATMLNMVALPQGGATRRPGTLYVATALSQANPVRLIPFVFSTVQAYMLEFAAGSVRVCMNDGLVMNGANPVVVTGLPYQAADLPAIKYFQSADTLYLCHPAYPMATLTRSSHTSWSYQALAFRDGPYLPLNATGTTLTPSGTTGAITLAASSTVGINATPQNSGQGFLATDVGRAVRVKVAAKWGWCVITAVNSATSVAATVQVAVTGGADGQLDGTTATVSWQLGKWSATTGYPWAGMFWQQRLVAAATSNQPNAVELSVTSDFTSFAPTADDGTVAATNAMSWVISDDQVNAVHWLSPAGSAQAMQLGIGTSGGEQILQAATTSQALTPTSVQAYRETTLGSAPNVPALRIGKSVLFVNRAGRKVYDWQFQWVVNGYIGIDRTVDAEHITRAQAGAGGIVAMAWQQQPWGIVWAVRADGALIGLTYLPEQQVIAWHRHQLGGDYYGGAPVVESIAVIPSPDGTYDELWLSVLRTLNGVPTRTVEVMARWFDGQPQDQAVFVDCALQSALVSPAATCTPSAASGTGATFTASAAVFGGASVGDLIRVNGGLATVRTYVDAQHVVGDWYQKAADVAPAAAGAWSCTPQDATFSGLSVLNGETVRILGDGADMGTAVVSAGAVTLPSGGTASFATIGLPYRSQIVTMPSEPKAAALAASAGKAKRIDTLWLRFRDSLGCDFGVWRTDPMTQAVDERLETLETRSAADMMGQPPALYSGIQRLKMPGGYDYEAQIEVTTSGPMPLTVLSIIAKANVGEVGP